MFDEKPRCWIGLQFRVAQDLQQSRQNWVLDTETVENLGSSTDSEKSGGSLHSFCGQVDVADGDGA